MTLLHDRLPGLDLGFSPLGTGPTLVRRLPEELVGHADVWVKDESTTATARGVATRSASSSGSCPRRGGGAPARSSPSAASAPTGGWRARSTPASRGCARCSAWSTNPSTTTCASSSPGWRRRGAELHRYRDSRRLRLAAPALLGRALLRDRRLPWYLPAGGSNPFGALAYVETALEIAAQIEAGELPAPATVVTAVGSGGTAAGLALGFRLAGLEARVVGVVVNDMLPLDAPVISGLANQTADLLRSRGAVLDLAPLSPRDLTMRRDWLGTTYGDPTPASTTAVADAARSGLTLEPVYTGKAVAAIRDSARERPDARPYPLAEHARTSLSSSRGRPTRGAPVPLTDVAPIEASIEIDAAPARVWELVSDLRNMPRWSPQCRRTIVRGGVMREGAKLVNINRRGLLFWPTQSMVTDFVPDERIAFRVKENWTIWSFDLEPTADWGHAAGAAPRGPEGDLRRVRAADQGGARWGRSVHRRARERHEPDPAADQGRRRALRPLLEAAPRAPS